MTKTMCASVKLNRCNNHIYFAGNEWKVAMLTNNAAAIVLVVFVDQGMNTFNCTS